MRNIVAIARKELATYFASPIAYAVIAMFALIFGYFFVSLLNWFVQQSMQVGADGHGRLGQRQPAAGALPAAERGGGHPVHACR